MNSLILLGDIPWVSNWLTPIWLVGMGAAIGLAAALLLWGIVFILSRVPPLGKLSDDKNSQRIFVGAGAVLLLMGYFWLGISSIRESAAIETAGKGPNPWVGLLLLSPICLLVPYALSVLMNRRTVRELPLTIDEGPLKPIGWVIIGLAACALLGFVVVKNPGEFFHSLARLPYARTVTLEQTIPASSTTEGKEDAEIDVPASPFKYTFQRDELRRIEVRSNEKVDFLLRAPDKNNPALPVGRTEVQADSVFNFQVMKQSLSQIFPDPEVNQVFVQNLGSKEAKVKVTFVTATPLPQVSTIVVTAMAVFLLIMAYILQSTLMPRVSAVALATFKSETAQPLFIILTLLGVCMLFLFVVIPYNTFGEDIKMLKDAGVKLILVITIIQAVWGASTSIAEEVEGRTALTVLSKPVTRSSFIIGKFLGIAWTVALMCVVFGVIFLVIVAYKPLYDDREGSFDAKDYGKMGFGAESPTWEICHWEMTSVAPGLVLGFMETIVITAISVAISTRLPMLANFIICFTIYVLGNLTPMIVKSSIGQFEIVSFVGQLIATIVPNLETFDIQAAVAAGQFVPSMYLWVSLLYCLIYTLIAMLLALLMFEDRDMA